MTQNYRLSGLAWGLLSAAALCMVQPVRAEDLESADPPSRVVRLSYVRGEVQLQSSENTDWIEAELNRPLTSKDTLWTEPSSRAELQTDSATIHLDESTGLSLEELSDDALRLQLTAGVISVHIKRLRDNETVEVSAPNADVSILEPGTYRLEADESGKTVVQVRSGKANVTGDRQSFTLEANERAEFLSNGDNARLAAQFSTAGALDDFDEWVASRNARSQRAATSRYVATDMIGYEDLDEYGDWRLDPEYGYAWFPTRVTYGWAPYRFGRWMWVAPWGWTWVDRASWGFAPFHYGRWLQRRDRWCWVPGPIGIRPVYAPALVAWLGRPGVAVSASFDVGWIPLGPREIYLPWYRTSRRYLHDVNNAGNVSNAHVDHVFERRPQNLEYMNRHPRGISAVDGSTFAGGRPVADHLVRLNDQSIRELRTSPEAPSLRPTWDSSRVSGRRFAGPRIDADRDFSSHVRSPGRNDQYSWNTQNRWRRTPVERRPQDFSDDRAAPQITQPRNEGRDRNWQTHRGEGWRPAERAEPERASPAATPASPPTSRAWSGRGSGGGGFERRDQGRAPSTWAPAEARPQGERRNEAWRRPTPNTIPDRAAPSFERRNDVMRPTPQFPAAGQGSPGGQRGESRSRFNDRPARDR